MAAGTSIRACFPVAAVLLWVRFRLHAHIRWDRMGVGKWVPAKIWVDFILWRSMSVHQYMGISTIESDQRFTAPAGMVLVLVDSYRVETNHHREKASSRYRPPAGVRAKANSEAENLGAATIPLCANDVEMTRFWLHACASSDGIPTGVARYSFSLPLYRDTRGAFHRPAR